MEVCTKVPHNCNFNYKNLTLQTCSNCAPWSPTQRKPPGLSPFDQVCYHIIQSIFSLYSVYVQSMFSLC